MKSTGSVVTYLIFEFHIPACYTYTCRPLGYVCIMHTVYENALLYFLWNIGPHSSIGGRSPNTTMRPRRGCHKGRLEPTNLDDTLQVRTYYRIRNCETEA